jgi:hypothetical protein
MKGRSVWTAIRRHWILNSLGAVAGVLLAVAAWGQPFVVPPQPVVITDAGGVGAVTLTGASLNVNCTAGCGGGGAVTANQGTPAVTANRWPVQLTDGVNLSLLTAAGRLTVDGSGVTQPVSGTVAATQGTSPWVVSGTVTTTPPANASTNITQFGGNPIVTGTGASGVGIPRVTVANDSAVIVSGTVTTTPPANASTNVTQFGSNAVVTGTGASGVGIPRVTVSNDSTVILGAGAATIGALTANQSVNLAQVGGTATVTGGVAGSQGVGGVSATNTAITQNPVLAGAETRGQGVQPTAATTGNQRQLLASLEGALFVQQGSSNRFSCFVQAVTATTQCQAAPAAGLRAYVTTIVLTNQVGTAQNVDVVFGTGAACVTGITALTNKIHFGAAVGNFSPELQTPLIPTAANAICLRPGAATAFGATLTGYIAP